MTQRIDMLAVEPHFLDHLAPIWNELPEENRGDFALNWARTPFTPEHLAKRAEGYGITAGKLGIEPRPVVVSANGDMNRARKAGRERIALLEHGTGQCLAPGTQILNAELRYVPVETLVPGDALVAFEEERSTAHWRHWRPATVTRTQVITQQCYRLHLSDGTSIVASAGHLWLTRDRRSYEWTRTENLQDAARWPSRSSKLLKCFDTWKEDRSWGAGYLAAAFDGEGHFTQTPRVGRQGRIAVGFSQRSNAMLELVKQELAARRFAFTLSKPHSTTEVVHLAVLGGTREVLRFIGSIRPRRLLAGMKPLENGQMRAQPVELQWLEPLGEQTVVGLETSTGTLIAEGFATHNSFGGDSDQTIARAASYPGGVNRGAASMFLSPNAHAAGRDRAAYPKARVEVIGCPKLDAAPTRDARAADAKPVVAISFHWDCMVCAETRSGWREWKRVLPFLAAEGRFQLIGHGHPRGIDEFIPHYRSNRFEVVRDFADVLRRADVYVNEGSSTLYEAAAAGLKVVVLNPSFFRPQVRHGLRFYDAAQVGPNVRSRNSVDTSLARKTVAAIDEAIADSAERQAQREAALDIMYAYRTGAAARAADAILDWVGDRVAKAAA